MKGLKEYEELNERSIKLYDILFEHLPKEYHYLLKELEEKTLQQLSLEIRHYFRKGVQAGITNLNYLKDAELEIIML